MVSERVNSSLLRATQTARRLSTIIHFRTFLALSLSSSWDPCSFSSTACSALHGHLLGHARDALHHAHSGGEAVCTLIVPYLRWAEILLQMDHAMRLGHDSFQERVSFSCAIQCLAHHLLLESRGVRVPSWSWVSGSKMLHCILTETLCAW